MAERPRELDQRFQVGVNLTLNYRLKGYFSCHCDMKQFTLTHHMVNKPFLLLGLAAKYRSLTVAVINVAADHPLWHWPANEVDSTWDDQPLTFTQNTKKSLFERHFRALRGNVRTPSMARWKARGRLYIRCNWTFLLSFTIETLWAEIGQSLRFSKGVGHFECRFQREGSVAHQPLLVPE